MKDLGIMKFLKFLKVVKSALALRLKPENGIDIPWEAFREFTLKCEWESSDKE